MAERLYGDWRRGTKEGSRIHYWFNDRTNGFPIQGFARPVCDLLIKHRNADPLVVYRDDPAICPKCLVWLVAHPASPR